MGTLKLIKRIGETPAGLSRRDFFRKVGTLGAVGVSLSVLPRWMPRLFRRDTRASAARIRALHHDIAVGSLG